MSVFVVRLRQPEWSVVPCWGQLRQLQLRTSYPVQLRVVAVLMTLAVHGCMVALGGMALAVQGGMAALASMAALAGSSGSAWQNMASVLVASAVHGGMASHGGAGSAGWLKMTA